MKTKNSSKGAKSKSTKKHAGVKPTLVAFLLDRTGSMSACCDETISGFNGYIDSLLEKKESKGMRFTLTQFDSQGIDVLHNCVTLEKVDKLNSDTYRPRAMTPLYDAIGKTIRATEAEAKGKYNVLFVTLTDGAENASTEWNSESVKSLIKEKEDKDHWTFAYIGVGLNGFAATQAVSKGTAGHSNVLQSDHKDTKAAYTRMATATVHYMACVGPSGPCGPKGKPGPVAKLWDGKS